MRERYRVPPLKFNAPGVPGPPRSLKKCLDQTEPPETWENGFQNPSTATLKSTPVENELKPS